MSKPRHGITADRKTPDKFQILLENHGKCSRKELAVKVGETERWVKRQVRKLIRAGKLSPTRKKPPQFLQESDWTDEMVELLVRSRRDFLLDNKKISDLLNERFGIKMSQHTVGFWARKFDCRFPTKFEWLREHISDSTLEGLLDKGLTVVQLSEWIKKQYDVYITDDLLLEYIHDRGMKGQKQRRIYLPNQKAREFSKEWMKEQINGHVGLVGIAEKMGVSTTIAQKRIRELGLKLIRHRTTWSKDLDDLRSSLLNVSPANTFSKKEFHQMMLGWLLGDGSIDRHGRFVVNHSLIQLSYLYLKARVLKGYLSNVTTIPRGTNVDKTFFVDKKEQLNLSCPGMIEYTRYLTTEGKKDYEKIVSEMDDLGWACYYMDDGSIMSGKFYISAKKGMTSTLENKYRFGASGRHLLELKKVNPFYIIPSMSYKVGDMPVGGFWKKHAPELFDFDVNSDMELSFVNNYVVQDSPEILNKAVSYYHKRGFPYLNLSEEYIQKEWDYLMKFNTKFHWKAPNVLRHVEVGNNIFKHYMKHMIEAKYKHVSPIEVFEGFMPLRKCLQYCLKSKKSILPGFVFNALVYFNGGVSGFPCAVSKSLVKKFSKAGDTVVDPCSGWGGRLLGTGAANRNYFGFEPWEKTHESLVRMIKDLRIKNAEVLAQEFCSKDAPSECALVLTSPPYIDLEVYGSRMSEKKWNELVSSIFSYAERSLIEGGFLVLNLDRFLYPMLPATKLKKYPTIFWFSSSRKRDIKKAEICYVWRKE